MSAALEVRVPDIGDFKDIPVIEVLVRPGDSINPEDPLVTLESDKATMEVPSPGSGTVKELKVKVGDKVSQGSLVLLLEGAAEAKPTAPAPSSAANTPSAEAAPAPAPAESAPAEPALSRSDPAPAVRRSAPPLAAPSAAVDEATFAAAHASPVVRRFARELGVELGKVQGSGPRGRILKDDVQAFVKQELGSPRAAAAGAGLNLLPWPQVDFAKFGAIESVALSRIKKLSGANLARNWAMIPHVTQHDEADTLLAFLMKASVVALKEFPQFNASLAADGESLVLKKYFHIGVAVDTPDGLVVPVIRDVDGKGVLELAKELAEVSANARARKLAPGSMQGGSFSISSLGGIGGTAFTPIINAPEVAILGIARSVTRPVYVNGELVPRVILPLSLSYDHRVVDGAQGARFAAFLVALLGDIRRLVL
jgi:pyruvate dehydrogenase E2 component (dihydrolipoamide acetyltransferase)